VPAWAELPATSAKRPLATSAAARDQNRAFMGVAFDGQN
jgi:hypothetical protein